MRRYLEFPLRVDLDELLSHPHGIKRVLDGINCVHVVTVWRIYDDHDCGEYYAISFGFGGRAVVKTSIGGTIICTNKDGMVSKLYDVGWLMYTSSQ